ncbi:argininosuccinate synthase domain-containing protein, partial [Priestia megaterium]|uniref:argininosuccinate synthase domain-containing protein n=1 Tax=Priestia megaterium TaxID=1404 RepID=UPI00164A012C
VIDGKEEYGNRFGLGGVEGERLYEGKYGLVCGVCRGVMGKKVVEVGEEENGVAVGHGCRGKGNEEVGLEV